MRKLIRFCIVFLTLLGWVSKPISKGSILRVAFVNNNSFYHVVLEDETVSGLHIDIMEHIAQHMGVQTEYVPLASWQECLDYVKNGNADLILGIPNQVQADILRTSEISAGEAAFIIRSDSKAAQQENLSLPLIYESTMVLSPLTGIPVSSTFEALQYLISGAADYVLCDESSARFSLNQLGLEDQYIVQPHADWGTFGYTIGVSLSSSSLLNRLNRAITEIRSDGSYAQIMKKWLPEEPRTVLFSSLKWIALIGGVGVAIALIYIVASSFIRKELKRRLTERTAQIAQKITELEQQSAVLRDIIESSPEGIVLFSQEGVVHLINTVACRIIGTDKSFEGQPVSSAPFLQAILSFTPEGLEDNPLFLWEGLDGETRYYWHITLRYNTVLYPDSHLLMIRDVTSEKLRQDAMIEGEKQRALNHMIAGMAHEIKNPLTGIRNFAELIETKKDSPVFLDSFAALVPREVDRISKLIESLLMYVRPGNGLPVEFDLAVVGEECMNFLRSVTHEKRICFTSDVVSATVLADKDQLWQILLNLMLNSVESMQKKLQDQKDIAKLTLRLTVKRQDDIATLTIEDEGEGMPTSILQQCMDPFFTTKTNGTGMGLALVKQLALQNRGILIIDSTEGSGTKVSLRFPIVAQKRKEQTNAEQRVDH